MPAEAIRARPANGLRALEQERHDAGVEFHHSPGLNVAQERLAGGGLKVTFRDGSSPGQQWLRVRLPPYQDRHTSSGASEMSSYGAERTPEDWAETLAAQYPDPSHGFAVEQEGTSVSFRPHVRGVDPPPRPRAGNLFADGSLFARRRAAREARLGQDVSIRRPPLAEPIAPLGTTPWHDGLWDNWNNGLWMEWNTLSDEAVRHVQPELLRRVLGGEVLLEMPIARILARAKEAHFTDSQFTAADLNQAISGSEARNRLPDVDKVRSALLRLTSAHGVDPRDVVFHGRPLAEAPAPSPEPTGESPDRAPLGKDGMPFISQYKPLGARRGYVGDGRCALASMAMIYRKFGVWNGLSDAQLIERLDAEDGMINRGTYQPSIRGMLDQTHQLEYSETLASGLSNAELERVLSRAGSLSGIPPEVHARVVPHASEWMWMHLIEDHPIVAQGFSNFPWNNSGSSHWVVFSGIEDGKVVVHDPEHPERKPDTVPLEQAAQFLRPASRLFAVGRKVPRS
jgi:hypothetical protein